MSYEIGVGKPIYEEDILFPFVTRQLRYMILFLELKLKQLCFSFLT